MSERRERIAVVGVGNILMGDEGVGVRAVEELEQENLPEGVELFDGGTAFYALSGELADFDRLIIVDAVEGGKPPGTIYRFEFREIGGGDKEARSSLSLHDVGVIEALTLERLIERMSCIRRIPEDIVFIGVEPGRIEPSMELSPILKAKLSTVVQRISEELRGGPGRLQARNKEESDDRFRIEAN